MQVEVRIDLEGWEIFFAELELLDGSSSHDALCELRRRTAEDVRARLNREELSSHPPVAALRRLFKEAGCDPTRYRPASEALLRRILKGNDIPAIHPFVDVNNCLSAKLGVPCCVMAEGSFEPPFVFRSGREEESYESLRGPFRLQGKPLLLDARGPIDAPVTGSERVKVTEGTRRAWLVAYLPRDVVTAGDAQKELETILETAPVARIEEKQSSR
jgi:DNA/RNA-binding domain of Phe-tRNA-synthetase-like protein